MTGLEIIGAPYSNYVRSIRMLCEEKAVAYTLTPARPHSDEVRAIHPAGQVPCLRHDGFPLFESLAIAFYIDRTFPGPKFIPEDALAGAQVLQWTSYTNSKVDRWIMREFVVPTVFCDPATGPDKAKIEAALPEIAKCLAVLGPAVAGRDFLAGDSLTYADMNLLPMLDVFAMFPQGQEALGRHPELAAYKDKLARRPSFVNTAPPPRK
jgi:glutathione S-transferase